jgi:hypothetical protein
MATIVFMTSEHWLSRVIRSATRSAVSHVGIGLELVGVPVILHASIGGVMVELRSKLMPGVKLVAECSMPVSGMEIERAVRSIGQRYDYVGLVGFIPVMLARWFGKRVKNPLASPSALVCSELVARALGKAWDGKIEGYERPDDVTPEDLLRLCRAWSASFPPV